LTVIDQFRTLKHRLQWAVAIWMRL